MIDKLKLIDRKLKRQFYRLGYHVGQHYHAYIIVPVIISILLSTGMYFVKYSTDPDHLLTPINGEGRQEKRLAESNFPTNFSRFDATRSTKFGLFGYVMVTSIDGGSILEPAEWDEVRMIQNLILNMEVEYNGKTYNYTQICAKWNGVCYSNSLLSFADTFAALTKGGFRDTLEDYYRNSHREFANLLGARNMSSFSLNKSNAVQNFQKLKVFTNQTVQEIKNTLGVMAKAADELERIIKILYEQYQTQIVPTLEAVNLPAYLGGITLHNKTFEVSDFCELLSYIKPELTGKSCTNPVELYSAISELSHEISDVQMTRNIVRKVNEKIHKAIDQLNLKEPSDKLVSSIFELGNTLEQLSTKLEAIYKTSDTLDFSQIVEAEAVLIGGLLDSDQFPEAGEIWEAKFVQMIDGLQLNLTKAAPVVSNSLKMQMLEGVEAIKPVLVANTLLIIAFSMMVAFTSDITSSKPWVGFAGVVTTILATTAGFGLLVFLNQEFTNFNYGAVFIMIGIGLDDTFVVMNSWHRTDRKADIPTRMADTMAEAGVSILITSLTDVLSFYSAIMAPYPYVRIFCVYTGTCILLLFLLQITLFVGCLAWSGRCEEENRSGLTLQHVPPNKRAREFLCFGQFEVPAIQADKKSSEEAKSLAVVRFLNRMLRSKFVRISVLFLYIVYIFAAMYGVMNVVVYFDKTKLINHDSSMKQFVDIETRLFRDKSFSISLIITGDVHYSKKETIVKIDQLLHRLESSKYINEHLTKSWLRHFQTVTYAKAYLLNQVQMFQTEEEFVAAIHDFFSNQSSPYSLDIVFNENATRIVASRFLIQGQNLHSSKDEERMVTELRSLCKEFSGHDFQAHVYNSYFPYTDQYLTIFGQTIQCILVTGAIVVSVSVLLLPDFVAAMSSVVSVVSTLVGTLGFMSLWGIVLDGITLINLIMCIGFSVDFSAHFCYHFIDIKAKKRTAAGQREKSFTGENSHLAGHGPADSSVAETLACVSKPVLQGGLSTILGVIGMLAAPCYSYVIFFKMILIVICLGIFHSLVLVPVLLQFLVDVRTGLRVVGAHTRGSLYGINNPLFVGKM